VKPLPIWLVGTGTIGTWLAGVLGGGVTARVRPEFVGPRDPLVNVNGTTNAVVFEAEPVGRVTATGPGPARSWPARES
jgi:homoserine dehydrogenase